MPGDKTFYAGISGSVFDNASCGVGVKSRRLDVVAATDVSKESTAGDVCALAVLR